jgi:tape measure domain-containing protein
MATVTVEVVAKDSFSGVLGNFGSIMTGIESAINLAGQAFQAFTGFAMQGLDAIASYEKLSTSIEALLAVELMQHGAAVDMAAAYEVAGLKTEEYLKWIQELAIHSPFTQEGVAEAFRMGLAMGFTSEETQRLTEAMINYTAATGQSEFVMERIVRVLGQISTTGKLLGQDWNQLAQAGVPVADILAEHFGKTKQQIMEMRSDGLLPAQEVIEAITVWMETNFAGAAEKFTTTWAGLLGTFSDLKDMGLREFFGGLFEAIRPLALAFSEWAQGSGMVLLGTLGEMLGTWASGMVDNLGNLAPIMTNINQAILQFSNLIDSDWTPLQALHKVLSDLAIVWGDTPLGSFTEKLAEFIQTADTEGLGAALRGLFENVDLQTTVQGLIDNLTGTLSNSNLSSVGDLIAKVISGSVLTVLQGLHIIINQVNWGPFGAALGGAIAQIWEGMANNPESMHLDMLARDMAQGLVDAFWDFLGDFLRADEIANAWERIWRDVEFGMMLGLSFDNMKFNISNFVNNLINYFKQLLGIASPSTVFAEIGRNIVLGLMSGILSMFPNLTTVVSTLFSLLTGGSGRTGGATGDATGLLGGGSGTIGGGGTSGVLMGGTVTNIYNFYGTTYVSGAGPAGTYDCAPTISSGGMIPAGVR